MKVIFRKEVWQTMLATAIGLLAFVGMAWAHPQVELRDAANNVITDNGAGTEAAYSVKTTCGRCHDYDNIEQHSFHAQLAANQQMGWDNWNPDSPVSFKSGPAPKGKSWVQAPGHIGKW